MIDLKTLANLFEALTIFCFGLSWPISIRKSYISRTAKGKSVVFEILLIVCYAFGIARKFIQIYGLGEKITFSTLEGWIFFLSFIFYFLNSIEISIDIALYFRNRKLDLAAKERHRIKNEATAKKLEEAEKLLNENKKSEE